MICGHVWDTKRRSLNFGHQEPRFGSQFGS
jgi:hypothetical protein